MHLPINISNNYPTIILVGTAVEFINISGIRPSLVYGISYTSLISPIVPLHPSLDENLSPCSIYLCDLSFVRTNFLSVSSLNTISSTKNYSYSEYTTEVSVYNIPSFSSLFAIFVFLLISTSYFDTIEPFLIIPF